jgi:hypothetical protein
MQFFVCKNAVDPVAEIDGQRYETNFTEDLLPNL